MLILIRSKNTYLESRGCLKVRKRVLGLLCAGMLASSALIPATTIANPVTSNPSFETQDENQAGQENQVANLFNGSDVISVEIDPADGPVETFETPDGIQIEFQIPDSNSSHERTIYTDVYGELSLDLHETGAVLISKDGETIGMLKVPWAKDANGVELETYYQIDGNIVTQVVVPTDSTAYPIVADPRVSWGIVSGHVYFSKEETRMAAAGAAGVAAIAPFTVLIPPPIGPAVATWVTHNSYNITIWATAAAAQGKCLQLKIGATSTIIPPNIGVTPEHYTVGCH